MSKNVGNSSFDLVDDSNTVITSSVTAIQNRFVSAFFYEDEIIYSIQSNTNYLLDPFIFGIGG